MKVSGESEGFTRQLSQEDIAFHRRTSVIAKDVLTKLMDAGDADALACSPHAAPGSHRAGQPSPGVGLRSHADEACGTPDLVSVARAGWSRGAAIPQLDAQFLRDHQGKLQARYNGVVEFASTLGGQCAYDNDLY